MVDRKNQKEVVVATARTETEGAMIVAQLEDAGIRAHIIDELSSGWRIGIPGDFRVVVLEEDVSKAMELLKE
jgi:hypothetical protein